MEGLVQRIVQWLVMLAGVLIALDLLGASSLVGAVLGSAGVAGLVLGFAFKDIAESHGFPPDFPSVEFAIGVSGLLVQQETVYSIAASDGGSSA